MNAWVPRGGGAIKLALCVLLSLYLLLAAGSGLDRIAANESQLAPLVPAPAQVGVLAARADRFIEAGIPGSALADAATLVSRDPLGTHATGLLGAARLGKSDAAGADAAFRVSARLGWRDARTQLHWLRAALAQQDFDRAALRFGALARQWPASPAIAVIASVIESSPAGRSALARRIAAGESWAGNYAVPPDQATTQLLAGRALVLGEAAALGRRLGCEPAAPLVRALAQTDAAMAHRLWQAQCPDNGRSGILRDGTFQAARLQQALTPFGWEFSGDGAVDIRLAADGDGERILAARNAGAMLRPFAGQRVLAGPGVYRLRINGRVMRGTLLASLACDRRREASEPVKVQQVAAGHTADLVFRGTCDAPWLQLWLAPGGEAELSQLELIRL